MSHVYTRRARKGAALVSRVTHINESCHIYERVMTQIYPPAIVLEHQHTHTLPPQVSRNAVPVKEPYISIKEPYISAKELWNAAPQNAKFEAQVGFEWHVLIVTLTPR